jgi:5'(3')-deoxyribonucleotidase
MARIGLDLDGVVYRFVDKLRDFIYETTGRPLDEMPPALVWDFFKLQWGYTTAEYKQFVIDGVNDLQIFWRGDMYEGAAEAINYMYKVRKDEIVFITSRHYTGVEKLAEHATFYWINNVAGLPYNELIFADDKTGYNLDVLFDDAPHNIEGLTAHGERVVAFDQPWNMHLTQADRVYGWKGLLDYVETHFPHDRNKNAMKIG